MWLSPHSGLGRSTRRLAEADFPVIVPQAEYELQLGTRVTKRAFGSSTEALTRPTRVSPGSPRDAAVAE